MNAILEVVSTLTAVVAAGVSVYFSLRASQDARLGQQLQVMGLKQQYFSGLQAWAKEVVSAMSDVIALCYLDPQKMAAGEFFNKRHALYSKLSALMDEGRWFFPNLHHEKVGEGKEEAYRGLREDVLNSIERQIGYIKKLDFNNQQPNAALAPGMV